MELNIYNAIKPFNMAKYFLIMRRENIYVLDVDRMFEFEHCIKSNWEKIISCGWYTDFLLDNNINTPDDYIQKCYSICDEIVRILNLVGKDLVDNSIISEICSEYLDNSYLSERSFGIGKISNIEEDKCDVWCKIEESGYKPPKDIENQKHYIEENNNIAKAFIPKLPKPSAQLIIKADIEGRTINMSNTMIVGNYKSGGIIEDTDCNVLCRIKDAGYKPPKPIKENKNDTIRGIDKELGLPYRYKYVDPFHRGDNSGHIEKLYVPITFKDYIKYYYYKLIGKIK